MLELKVELFLLEMVQSGQLTRFEHRQDSEHLLHFDAFMDRQVWTSENRLKVIEGVMAFEERSGMPIMLDLRRERLNAHPG